MSIPVETPAEVQRLSSTTYSESASTLTRGYALASGAQAFQCVATQRPSSSFRLASTNAPEQTEPNLGTLLASLESHARKPGSAIARMSSSLRAPMTSSVSGRESKASVDNDWTATPLLLRTRPPSVEMTSTA